MIYLPEIKYRRILNKAFGPGGWGLAPRSETHVGPKVVSREYALVCLGRCVSLPRVHMAVMETNRRRLVGVARGEQDYFDPAGIPTATEAVKSNALMRCCKDLGIASELWYDLQYALTEMFLRDSQGIRASSGNSRLSTVSRSSLKIRPQRKSQLTIVSEAHSRWLISRRKKLWRRKDQPKFDYPWKE